MTIGTMPPIRNRICQPCVGTKRRGDEARNGAADRHAADRDDRQRGAQLARRGFGVDGDDVRDDAADAEARQQTQPEHLVEIGRIGRRKREDAEQQVRPTSAALRP